MNDRYLMHYGVKGMKWGVRHEPQSSSQSKSSFNLSSKQKKILKRVAIGAAIVGGGMAAAYLYKSVGKTYFDSHVFRGTTFQTMTHAPERIKSGEKAFYASFSKIDNIRYKGLFGSGGYKPDNKFITTGKFNKNSKIAGLNTNKKLYNELISKDKKFADSISKLGFKDHKDFNKRGLRDYSYVDLGKASRSDYNYARDSFVNYMKNKGYSGVIDYQDRSAKQFNAKSATILFGNNYNNVKARQITDKEIQNAYKFISKYDSIRLRLKL